MMLLEPEVQAHLETGDAHGLTEAGPAQLRVLLRREIDRAFSRFGEPGPEVDAILDHEVPVEGGTILLRTYHPTNPTGRPLPAHVIVHGGGWVTGSVHELVCDATARHRAVKGECIAVLVEYRLAPEHPFPTPLYDVVASLRWVRDHAAELGVDPDVITGGGSSAGANLVAGAVLAAPDLSLRALILDVPALDLRPGAAVVPADLDAEYDELLASTIEQYEPVLTAYLPRRELSLSPLVSPILAEDPSVFPETHLFVAELDVLRPAAEDFARRLETADVPVTLTCYPGALHGSAILTKSWVTARRWHEDTLAILRTVHSRPRVESGRTSLSSTAAATA
jgi:acetyl esterase